VIENKKIIKNESAFITSITKKFDSIKPTVQLNKSSVNGQFLAFFSEEVKEDSATYYRNYALDGNELPAGTTFTMSSDKKFVTITLPEGTIPFTQDYTLTVKDVKDLSDNVIDPYAARTLLTDNTPPVLTAAVLDSKKILN